MAAAIALALSPAVLSCTAFAPQTRVIVLHTTTADHSLREEGTNLNIDHWQLENAPSGLEKGFFVVKSELEWHQHWPTTETEKVPVLPADLNFDKEMLLISSPPEHDVLASEVRTIVMNEGGIHAYVTETMPGVDCPPPDKDAKPNFDLARVPLVDGKDVQFHIETSPADSCGSAPEAKITCRGSVPGAKATTPYVQKLNVDPGTKVSCIVGAFTSPRPVIDLTWTFAGLPLGAATKMIVGSRGTGVTFTPDVFGSYDLQLEVLDDLQRRGASVTEVTVTPKAPLVLQLIWTKFDPDDDPSTFPRIELSTLSLNPDGSVVGGPAARVVKKVVKPLKKGAVAVVTAPEAPPLPGTPGAPPIVFGKANACSLESAAPFCKAETMGFTTVMSMDASAAKMFAVGVHYTDDRVDGQAVPCVRAYRDGKLVTDLCETAPHKADTWWKVAVLDSETAKTVQTIENERAAAATKAAADEKAAADKAALEKERADAKAAADKAAADKAAAAAAARPSPAASGSPASSAVPAVSARPASSAAPIVPPESDATCSVGHRAEEVVLRFSAKTTCEASVASTGTQH